jgi:hypothetical protein
MISSIMIQLLAVTGRYYISKSTRCNDFNFGIITTIVCLTFEKTDGTKDETSRDHISYALT